MTKLQVKKKKAAVKKANKSFSRLNKAEKAVFIAKDILKQIELGKIIAETGKYVRHINFKDDPDFDKISEFEDKGIKENYNEIENCTCCAMGAAIMCITKQKNKLTFSEVTQSPDEFIRDGEITDMLKSVFSPIQLLLIETAFEGYQENYHSVGKELGATLTIEESRVCNRIYKRFSNENNRLKFIMNNIIYNKGIFKI